LTVADSPDARAALSQSRGSYRDLNRGPILRTLLIFSAPTLASNILQSLSGSINSVWVGHTLGPNALAATANANVIMFLVFATVFGFGMAAMIKVGQAFGAGNVAAARLTFANALTLCTGLTLIIAPAGWLCAPQLLHAMATPPEIFPLALTYLRVLIIGLPPAMVTLIIGMGLRGAGDSATSLRFMVLSVVLDTALNPLLILGIGPFPRLGIAGSALASTLASTTAMAAILLYVYARNLPVRLGWSELGYLRPRAGELRFILGKGMPMGAQMLLVASSGLIMIGLVNREGAMASAAYGASLQVWTYLQMPAMAIAASLSAMVAQALGAGLIDRLDKVTRAALILHFAITGAMALLLAVFDRSVMELFLGGQEQTVTLARNVQLLASWSFIMFGITIMLFGAMRAGGVVLVPLFVMGTALYPVRLGFYALAYPAIGADAIWLAYPVGSFAAVAMAAFAYRRPEWRKRAQMIPSAGAPEETRADGDCAGRMAPQA
jgi:putative MATE family efflux protein